jgi:hypothetical protein
MMALVAPAADVAAKVFRLTTAGRLIALPHDCGSRRAGLGV